MARLSSIQPTAQTAGLLNSSATPKSSRINSSALEIASSELGQLLYRLQRSILHADTDRERLLRTSEFERARVEANLDHARTSLTKLEQDALGIKAPGRRSEVQGDLNKKRELLEQLMDRIEDLRQMADDDEDDDVTSGDEDILSEIIPTPSESMASTSLASTSADVRMDTPIEDESEDLPPSESATGAEVPVPASTSPPEDLPPELSTSSLPTQTSQTFRNRGSAPSPDPLSARAALFANRRKPVAEATTSASTATAEAILDNQRAEQDQLSESILKMAGMLKASSQKFSSSMDADKEVVEKAGEGMDKTERGMEAARGRMGTLRKMTEGQGWWGRIILYAWVYGLMVGLMVLVFVMPKLRF